MTREEAKALLPVIMAFSEGKPIQAKELGKWKDIDNFNFAMKSTDCYRIKPEPKYRPFNNAEECWNEMLKHQPFGWVKDKTETYVQIILVGSGRVYTRDTYPTFYDANLSYKFADGTPFGVREEE